jgi:hypothetical protein
MLSPAPVRPTRMPRLSSMLLLRRPPRMSMVPSSASRDYVMSARTQECVRAGVRCPRTDTAAQRPNTDAGAKSTLKTGSYRLITDLARRLQSLCPSDASNLQNAVSD